MAVGMARSGGASSVGSAKVRLTNNRHSAHRLVRWPSQTMRSPRNDGFRRLDSKLNDRCFARGGVPRAARRQGGFKYPGPWTPGLRENSTLENVSAAVAP